MLQTVISKIEHSVPTSCISMLCLRTRRAFMTRTMAACKNILRSSSTALWVLSTSWRQHTVQTTSNRASGKRLPLCPQHCGVKQTLTSSQLVSDWILTSRQLHGGHLRKINKQIHISKLSSYINRFSSQSRKPVPTQTSIKPYIHKHQTHIFQQLVPSILPLSKVHARLGHAGIIDLSI